MSLLFENKAYFDILRTWKAYESKNNRFVDAFTFQNESGVTFKKQYLNWLYLLLRLIQIQI